MGDPPPERWAMECPASGSSALQTRLRLATMAWRRARCTHSPGRLAVPVPRPTNTATKAAEMLCRIIFS